MMGYGHLGYGAGQVAGFGFGGMIFMFIAAALITGLIIWLLTSNRHGMMAAHPAHYGAYTAPTQLPGEDEALRIARERLAKGEIDAGQYSAIVTALKS